jgi:putative transcriptional regulator
MSNKQHCPSTEMLTEFSAGTLETAASICVSAHLHYCEKCRSKLLRLNEVGAQLMVQGKPVDIDDHDSLFATVMTKIDQSVNTRSPQFEERVDSKLPPAVEKVLAAAPEPPIWRRLTKSLEVKRLVTGQNQFEVALHKIHAGGKTPQHDHRGTEYTVVLKGSFSDEKSVYSEGDFIVRQPGDIHQPMGANNGECICLSALEAPVKLTGPLSFMFKPWLRINPM